MAITWINHDPDKKTRQPVRRPWRFGPFDLWWRIERLHPERKGTSCRVLARGSMNSVIVEFESDGLRIVTSGNYLRKRRPCRENH